MTDNLREKNIHCQHYIITKATPGAPGGMWQECELCGETLNDIIASVTKEAEELAKEHIRIIEVFQNKLNNCREEKAEAERKGILRLASRFRGRGKTNLTGPEMSLVIQREADKLIHQLGFKTSQDKVTDLQPTTPESQDNVTSEAQE